MSDKNSKTSLEEAKLNFEEIQKFAKEQASAQLEEQVAQKLMKIFEEKLNEDVTITIKSDDGAENVEVSKEENLGSISSLGGMELDGVEKSEEDFDDADDSEFMVSDEDDEIGLEKPEEHYEEKEETMDEMIQNENMKEMDNIKMEQEAPVPAPVAPTEAPVETPTEAPAQTETTAPDMAELLSKMDTLINVLMQKEGAPAETAEVPAGAEAGTEEEFDVIDDEKPVVPVATPAPAPETTPVQEEFEITDFEDKDKDKEFIDEMEEQMLEIVDEDEMPIEGEEIDEMLGVGQSLRRSNRLGKLPRQGTEHRMEINESKIKAQYESKVDELVKENNSLKKSVNDLNKERKEFEQSFVGLRTQFNEMQLFNGKLALVNKVLMNGGLTTEEKIKVCEQFDSVQTYEEANKLFKTVIKENNIKIGDVSSKLKGASTNTGKPKNSIEPLYESDEARRAKKLAGIGKFEEE